jgi:hypothetical protein
VRKNSPKQGVVWLYSLSCRERLSGKSKQALFLSLKSAQIETNKLYLALLCHHKSGSTSLTAIFQTVSEETFSETRCHR